MSVRPGPTPLKLVRLCLLIEAADSQDMKQIADDMRALRDSLQRYVSPSYRVVSGVGGCSIALVKNEVAYRLEVNKWFRPDGGPR